jgi:hypothetical protein
MRRSGAVFYLDVNYGDNKGSVASGTNMFSSVNGPNQTQGGREFSSQRVYGEVISTTTSSGSPYQLLNKHVQFCERSKSNTGWS